MANTAAFLRRTLTVDQQVQPGEGGVVEACPLRNRVGYRRLPVGQVVVHVEAAHPLSSLPSALSGCSATMTAGRRALASP